jgi:hypothetical protein
VLPCDCLTVVEATHLRMLFVLSANAPSRQPQSSGVFQPSSSASSPDVQVLTPGRRRSWRSDKLGGEHRSEVCVQKLLAAPELVARTWAVAKREGEDDNTERVVMVLLVGFVLGTLVDDRGMLAGIGDVPVTASPRWTRFARTL